MCVWWWWAQISWAFSEFFCILWSSNIGMVIINYKFSHIFSNLNSTFFFQNSIFKTFSQVYSFNQNQPLVWNPGLCSLLSIWSGLKRTQLPLNSFLFFIGRILLIFFTNLPTYENFIFYSMNVLLCSLFIRLDCTGAAFSTHSHQICSKGSGTHVIWGDDPK